MAFDAARLRGCLAALALTLALPVLAQRTATLTVRDASDHSPIEYFELHPLGQRSGVEIKSENYGRVNITFPDTVTSADFTLFAVGYAARELTLAPGDDRQIELEPLTLELSAVNVVAARRRRTALSRLRAVEGTAIYAGKKTEVVAVDALTANLASNQARQLYAQVSGLNIYESDDAGLQLSIGGRGLDPNRSASFNTRQNGYDISADVLGYPESYYTPPAEALREVQIVRGAASLQYGTQFGGLVNFRFREPKRNDRLEFLSRQTVGRFGLFTSFNSLSGQLGKVGYYGFYNHKRGDGFRPNSEFSSDNIFLHLDYRVREDSRLSLEYTHLSYLAQQAGGLTDRQFYADPLQSNRARNWFTVDWNLFNLRYDHKLSEQTSLSTSLFGLDASRGAVGFRSNRVSQVDDPAQPRDLIVNDFRNWGLEQRILHRYRIGRRPAIALLGAKYYRAANAARQGPGSAGADPDFRPANDRFPAYPAQSEFTFPNRNLALFGEHIFYLTDRLSLTPGARFERIRTEIAGQYRSINFDLAGNPIRNEQIADDRVFARSILLLGVGLSLRQSDRLEYYANVSQNYRSVTFNDIRTVNPSFRVDPDITDERGYTADAGLRLSTERLSLAANVFGLRYADRLGEVLARETRLVNGVERETGRLIRRRGNIGAAFLYGLESLTEYTLGEGKTSAGTDYRLAAYANLSLTRSRYTASEENGVVGNEVEFIPLVNARGGLTFGYGNLLGSLQYAYLSRQFTDASNAPQDRSDNQRGIEGSIPAYGVLDLSLSYDYRRWRLESGVNNLLNETYFTRRATGYPGPGIIPSAPRSWYLTVGIRI